MGKPNGFPRFALSGRTGSGIPAGMMRLFFNSIKTLTGRLLEFLEQIAGLFDADKIALFLGEFK